MPLSHSGLILFIASAMAWASPPQSASRIMVSSESPALHVANARFNPHSNKVGGVVSLNFGYAAPWSPHVHIFALDSSGTLLYKSCDKLMRHLLVRNPRLHRGRDSFSVSLPAKLHGIATIRVVASGGHAGSTWIIGEFSQSINFQDPSLSLLLKLDSHNSRPAFPEPKQTICQTRLN